VNCDGDADMDLDIEISMLVEALLMFIDAELEGVCIVMFIMLVVEVVVPEYAVYAADSLLMDDTMLAGMLLVMSAMEIDDVVDGAMHDWPAAPQSVLANARAADKRLVVFIWVSARMYEPVWSLAEQPSAMAARSASRTAAFAQMQATSVIAQPDC
jgi:hypothetical protein